MAETSTVSYAENKRSLPAWMLKTSSLNQEAQVEDQNKQALESDGQIRALNQSKPIKRNRGRPLSNLNSETAGELVVLGRCDGREKARIKSKDVVKEEVEEIDELKSKNARKAGGRAAPKNSRKRKLQNVKSEASSLVAIDDDIELTVEDLVSIAEEYVNADKQKKCELETVKTTRHKECLLLPTISTEAGIGQTVVNAPSVKEFMQCTTVTRNTRASEHTENKIENNNHQEVQCPSSAKTTEDVAQDMLNLFFGHLLSKPVGYSKKSDPVESMTVTDHVPEEKSWHSKRQGEPVKKSEPMESTATTMHHVPEKKDWRSELLQKQGEPAPKKKSSLRDKVALFY